MIAEARRLGALSVRGNHDDSGLAAYEALQRGEEVKEKHEWVRNMSAADAHWLGQLPWSISIPSYSLLVVHAGVVPEVRIQAAATPPMDSSRCAVQRHSVRAGGPSEQKQASAIRSHTPFVYEG